MAKKKAQKQNVIDNLAAGLGALAWWSLSSTKCSPERLRRILREHGQDETIVPDISQKAAVKRAVRSWSKGRGNADRYRAVVPRDTAGDLTVTINILKLTKTGDAKDEYLHHDRLVFDPGAGSWSEPGCTPEAEEFRMAADDARTYHDHTFIRPVIIQARFNDWGAFSLRSQGGVYYVANRFADELEMLQKIVAAIGDSSLSVVTVSDTAASRESIGREATNHCGSLLGELRGKLAAWTEQAKIRAPRADALGNALKELKQLKAHAETYAEALSLSLDGLYGEIDSAVAEAQALLGTSGREGRAKRVYADLGAKLAELDAEHGGAVPVDALLAAGFPRSVTRYDYWNVHLAATVGSIGRKAMLRKKQQIVQFIPVAQADVDEAAA